MRMCVRVCVYSRERLYAYGCICVRTRNILNNK